MIARFFFLSIGLSSTGRPSAKPKDDTSLSLDTFQARYTSEDFSLCGKNR